MDAGGEVALLLLGLGVEAGGGPLGRGALRVGEPQEGLDERGLSRPVGAGDGEGPDGPVARHVGGSPRKGTRPRAGTAAPALGSRTAFRNSLSPIAPVEGGSEITFRSGRGDGRAGGCAGGSAFGAEQAAGSAGAQSNRSSLSYPAQQARQRFAHPVDHELDGDGGEEQTGGTLQHFEAGPAHH